MRTLTLKNGLTFQLVTRGKHFLGLGRITAGKVALRSGRRPMSAEVRSPDARKLCNYRIESEEVTDTGFRLTLAADVAQGDVMDWMVHSVRNRYNTADWSVPPAPAADTRLVLEVESVTRTLGGRAYTGFRYQYRYRSASMPIYKILDRGTWEIGGRATGSEFWMRACFVPSIAKFTSPEAFYSTEWYLPDIANPNIFQFLPFQTEFQGFTFTASPKGVLVTWATEVAHVRSLFEKPRGADEIVHWHEHCGDLGTELASAPVEVLWCPGKLDRVGLANAYEDVREMVHATLHDAIGMRRERIAPYGQIEEWGDADLPRYTRLGVPKLLEAGMKTIGLANHFENNMNVWGVSNMCCTVDYRFAESVGVENVRALCEAARHGGARVEMWGNTSVSSLTHIFNGIGRHGRAERIKFIPKEDSIMEAFEKTPAPWVRNPSGAIEADHYTPVFCVMNLRDPVVRDYWLKRWKEAADVGLGGIFLDSSFNLSSDKFHFQYDAQAGRRGGATADQVDLLGKVRPANEPSQAILSQYRAHLDLMAGMQRIGYQYCSEDLGVFGIHRHGPGLDQRLNCLSIWQECIANFDVPTLRKLGADPDDVFFRGLAYRMMWTVYWNIPSDRLSFCYDGVRGDFDVPTPWHLAILKAFASVGDRMTGRRTVLPKEVGVVYETDSGQVLWAFRAFSHDLGGKATVRDVVDGNEAEAEGSFKARKQHAYVIERAQ